VLGLSLFTGLNAALGACGKTTVEAEPEVTNPEEALARLVAGNKRFAEGTPRHPDQTVVHREDLSSGQKPFAAVFSCVDSRVPPELVFDQGLGDLFVIRSAGHVLDRAILGSLQYGVAELEIPLLVVMGHENCGAVNATVEAVEKGSGPTGTDIDALIAAIKPAVLEAEAVEADDLLDAAISANVLAVAANLAKRPILKAAVIAGDLRIVGARYDLDDGTIAVL
jgi:carbonic anhydrase